VCGGKRPRRRGNAIESRGDDRDRRSQLQDEPGVDDVLTGGAEVHPLRGVLVAQSDACAQLAYQGNREIAIDRGITGERREIELVRACRIRDRHHGRRRDDAQRRLCLCEGHFDIEHRLYGRDVRQMTRHVRIAEQHTIERLARGHAGRALLRHA
jgi:hypothetical protein